MLAWPSLIGIVVMTFPLAPRTEAGERALASLDGRPSRDGALLSARLEKRYADRITGSFTIPGLNDNQQYTVTDSFNFALIAGPDFTVLFQISSPTTPGGGGSIGWEHGVESSFFTVSDEGGAQTPEPGTFALMLAPALAGVWALRRRKR